MPGSSLTLALVQQSDQGSTAANLEDCEAAIRAASIRGCDLVVLQELHNGPYFCQIEDNNLFDLAETIPGPSTERLSTLARELNLVIVGSLFEQRAPGIYHSTAVVLDADGSLAGIYRKMHIPDLPGHAETFYFTPGDLGFNPIDTSLGRLGVLIGWDQWFPEAARAMALGGAQILLYPSAMGADPNEDEDEVRRQIDAWLTIQRGHAIANALYVAACNRVGYEPDPSGVTSGLRFWGHSFICGPQGELIAQADDQTPKLLIAEVDLARTEPIRRRWPFLRDRRIESYDDLARRFRD
ncbi:carbon-nitrogen hydrolase [Caldichromatium japonicum]|uniref:Carbon-nitrogen hydrolase n=1 Tax=Caldichromatium japonicum TaxID=2699430 RepID=A0A6G7VCV3_9GAMM|nr:carbon-nitrogen hydrolase [Caldichromatium japonicum]QIK37851.1 carbon-nitrogen hydrolase [Caldichromatium japonicum]